MIALRSLGFSAKTSILEVHHEDCGYICSQTGLFTSALSPYLLVKSATHLFLSLTLLIFQMNLFIGKFIGCHIDKFVY